MRKLIYIPIIHTSADLGSLAEDINRRNINDLGEEFWEKYKRIVDRFWMSVSRYCDSIDAKGIKIYQDGMVAGGEVAKSIADEVAKSGSKNFEIVSALVKRGAILEKTEDLKLIKEERDSLVAIIHAKTISKKIISFLKYKMIKKNLLNKRDSFIVKRIDETLSENETGIIFIGAYHNVKKRLPGNIEVTEVKNIEKVKEFQKIVPFYNKNKKRFDELSSYLVSK